MKWKKDFGLLRSGPYDMPSLEWGFSSSPIIYEDKVVMRCDVLNDPFIAVLDLASGKELLRIKRADVAGWSTPLVVHAGGRTQLVCNGYRHMGAYDLNSGKERLVTGEGGRYYASPVAAGGKIYLVNLSGEVQVIRAGRTFERLGTMPMGESCFATPAISDGRLFVRTRHHLYCLGR